MIFRPIGTATTIGGQERNRTPSPSVPSLGTKTTPSSTNAVSSFASVPA